MRHSVLREGIIAGALGATAVAIWFAIIDMIGGQLFFTPTTLGRGFLNFFGSSNASQFAQVAIWTVIHYVAFFIVGWIAVAILHVAQRQPAILAGALMLFVVVEIGFYAMSSALAVLPNFKGPMSWLAVGAGNLIAAVVMGVYLWRTHPGLRSGLSSALGGREPPD